MDRLGGLLLVVEGVRAAAVVVAAPAPADEEVAVDDSCLAFKAARRWRSSSSLDFADVVSVADADAVVVDRGGVRVPELPVLLVTVVVAAALPAPVANSRRNRSSSNRVRVRLRTAFARTKIPHFSGHSK